MCGYCLSFHYTWWKLYTQLYDINAHINFLVSHIILIYVYVDVAKLMIFYAMNLCIHIWKCYMDYLFKRESLIENVNITLMYWMFNSSDDEFIRVGLGGMGYSCKLYKKIIPNFKFIKSWFQIRIINFFFSSCNVSKCPYGS
jgi:hypothetical protein